MFQWKFFTHFVLLITGPFLVAYAEQPLFTLQCQPLGSFANESSNDQEESISFNTYDDIMQMLHDLESGYLETKYSPAMLEKINHFIIMLAKEGLSSEQVAEREALEKDSCALICGKDNASALTYALHTNTAYIKTSPLQPFLAKYRLLDRLLRLLGSTWNPFWGISVKMRGFPTYPFFRHVNLSWKDTKNFLYRHRTEIIIGVVVVVTVAAIAAGVAASVSAAPVVAGVTAVGSDNSPVPDYGSVKSTSCGSNENPLSSIDFSEIPDFAKQLPKFEDALSNNMQPFIERVVQRQCYEQLEEGLSLEERARVLAPIFREQALNVFNDSVLKQMECFQNSQYITVEEDFSSSFTEANDPVDRALPQIDETFVDSLQIVSTESVEETNFNALCHEKIAGAAHSQGYYQQSVMELSKAIDLTPDDPELYRARSVSYLQMGEYEKSQEDFARFTQESEKMRQQNELTVEKTQYPSLEFCQGFAVGAVKGMCKAKAAPYLFLADFVIEPRQTSIQAYQAIETLCQHAYYLELEKLSEALSPQLYEAVTQWPHLTPYRRGELVGEGVLEPTSNYAIGKGKQFFKKNTPKQVVRNCNRSIKEIKNAPETILSETVHQIQDSKLVKRIIGTGEDTFFFGRELGLDP